MGKLIETYSQALCCERTKLKPKKLFVWTTIKSMIKNKATADQVYSFGF